MAVSDFPSVDYVRQCLRYEDGKLYWLERPIGHFHRERDWKRWNTVFSGKEAGYVHWNGSDYRHRISINNIKYFRYTIVFVLKNGYWPENILDHKNANSLDDNIDNFRFATESQNKMNSRIRKDNTSGKKGVCWEKRRRKWVVAISVNKRNIYIGQFDDIEEAARARAEAAEKYHGEFARSF